MEHTKEGRVDLGTQSWREIFASGDTGLNFSPAPYWLATGPWAGDVRSVGLGFFSFSSENVHKEYAILSSIVGDDNNSWKYLEEYRGRGEILDKYFGS